MSESKSDADDTCPDCGGKTTFGFGLAFGGEPSGYLLCMTCPWFEKPGSNGAVTCLDQADAEPGDRS